MIASLITGFYLLDFVRAGEASTFLYIYGALLLIAEIGVVSFGLLALNGALAIYVGYIIQTGNNTIFGVDLNWPFVFGVAFVELTAIAVCAMVLIRHRRQKLTTGTESMIGHKAVVLEWQGMHGSVLIQGETWKAYSEKALELNKNSEVIVDAVEGLKVKISA